VHQDREQLSSDVVDTIRRRMERCEEQAAVVDEAAKLSEAQPVAAYPASINRARFAALSSRLAQVAAKASADSLSRVDRAHDRMPMDDVLRFLTDVRRIADAVAEFATIGCPVSGSDR
jgi:regulator of protease activity HflC (stomatin/prohibitin superfamily)